MEVTISELHAQKILYLELYFQRYTAHPTSKQVKLLIYRHPEEWRALLPSAWETEGLKKEFAISQELHNLMEENAS